jgi:hypothetical protein
VQNKKTEMEKKRKQNTVANRNIPSKSNRRSPKVTLPNYLPLVILDREALIVEYKALWRKQIRLLVCILVVLPYISKGRIPVGKLDIQTDSRSWIITDTAVSVNT